MQTGICVGVHVAISGINIVPEVGLYNSAQCKVINIVYTTSKGPNNKLHYYLPKYVVFDFSGLQFTKLHKSLGLKQPHGKAYKSESMQLILLPTPPMFQTPLQYIVVVCRPLVERDYPHAMSLAGQRLLYAPD